MGTRVDNGISTEETCCGGPKRPGSIRCRRRFAHEVMHDKRFQFG